MNAFDHAIAPIVPVLLAITALACLAGIIRAALIIPLHVSLDPDEGWNAYLTAAAMAGHGLYPRAGSFMVNNYPPLSFYFVGLLGLSTGDPIVAGRIISLVSSVCVCGFVYLSARRIGSGLQGAIFSAMLLAAMLLLTSDYVGMNDPQLLAQALQLAALYLVLRDPHGARMIIGAALLFVLGGFVKHNLFVLPLASLLWLASFDRRNALRLALWCGGLSLCGLIIFRVLFGFDLLDRLATARTWSLLHFSSGLIAWLPFVTIADIGLAALVLWRSKEPPVLFVTIYAAFAICAGAFMAGGAGVDVNAMFDADIALALGAGLLLGGLLQQQSPWPHLAGRAFAFAVLIPFVVPALQNRDWHDASFWLHPMQDETALAAQDIAFLHTHPGPVICESLALCYWAGKPDPVDVFNLDQQMLTGRRNQEPFLQLIGAHRFATIELDETDPFPLPRTVESAMLFNYHIDHTNDEATFLVPR